MQDLLTQILASRKGRAKVQALTPQQERDLIRRARSRDVDMADDVIAAREALIEQFAPLLRSSVYKYRRYMTMAQHEPPSFEEALSAVLAALLEFIQTFDSRNANGSYYAGPILWKLKAVLLNAIAAEYSQRFPTSVPAEHIWRYWKATSKAVDPEMPTAAELEKQGVGRPQFEAVRGALDPFTGELDNLAESYFITAFEVYTPIEDRIIATAALNACDDQQRAVLRLHFGLGGGEPRSVAEISKVLGIHERTVRRLRASGFAAARTALGVGAEAPHTTEQALAA